MFLFDNENLQNYIIKVFVCLVLEILNKRENEKSRAFHVKKGKYTLTGGSESFRAKRKKQENFLL